MAVHRVELALPSTDIQNADVVVNVWSDGCKVLLLTDGDFSVSAQVLARHPVTGIAEGRAGSSTLSLPLDGVTGSASVIRASFVGGSFQRRSMSGTPSSLALREG